MPRMYMHTHIYPRRYRALLQTPVTASLGDRTHILLHGMTGDIYSLNVAGSDRAR